MIDDPIACRLPAEPGWRAVVLEQRDDTLFARVITVTCWGLRAPKIDLPKPARFAIVDLTGVLAAIGGVWGDGVRDSPLVPLTPEGVPIVARWIVPPCDKSDAELLDEVKAWVAAVIEKNPELKKKTADAVETAVSEARCPWAERGRRCTFAAGHDGSCSNEACLGCTDDEFIAGCPVHSTSARAEVKAVPYSPNEPAFVAKDRDRWRAKALAAENELAALRSADPAGSCAVCGKPSDAKHSDLTLSKAHQAGIDVGRAEAAGEQPFAVRSANPVCGDTIPRSRVSSLDTLVIQGAAEHRCGEGPWGEVDRETAAQVLASIEQMLDDYPPNIAKPGRSYISERRPTEYPGTSTMRERLTLAYRRWVGWEPSWDAELMLYAVYEMAHAEGFARGKACVSRSETAVPVTTQAILDWLECTAIDIEETMGKTQYSDALRDAATGIRAGLPVLEKGTER